MTRVDASLVKSIPGRAFDVFDRIRDSYSPPLRVEEVGRVQSVSNGIAVVTGLRGVGYDELVRFESGEFGIALNVDEEMAACILLGSGGSIMAGAEAKRTARIADVMVGDGLLGRVIDATNRPLDGGKALSDCKRMPIECDAPNIMDRAPVTVPLQTGIKVIDSLVPIGRGQRELILGDRQTGKTSIAMDTILNQTASGMICVYCAIGQRSSSVAQSIATLKASRALEHTVVVVAEGNDAPGLRYITPYAATTIAEYFMRQGRDALIVYDDLTQHARAYRELSLLLRRPPGREAFPGDIFYIHSRLLERATHLRPELGGGSLTALPVIETEAQDVSAYIPTNLISITDGQLVLSPSLFQRGILPAVDVGRSVSRVGGKAQLASYRAVTGDLKLAYAQFEELEAFARFGTRIDAETSKRLEHGLRIRACLKQPRNAPIPIDEQIAVLLALQNGLFDAVPTERMQEAEAAVRKIAPAMPEAARTRILSGEIMTTEDSNALIVLVRTALAQFLEQEK